MVGYASQRGGYILGHVFGSEEVEHAVIAQHFLRVVEIVLPGDYPFAFIYGPAVYRCPLSLRIHFRYAQFLFQLYQLGFHAVYFRLLRCYPALDIRERFSVAPLLAVAHILKLLRHPFLFGYGADHGVGFALGYIELRYQVLVFFLGVLQNVRIYRLHHGVDMVKVLLIYLPVGFGKALDFLPRIGEIPLKVCLGIFYHFTVRPLILPFSVTLGSYIFFALRLYVILPHDLLIGFYRGSKGFAIIAACLVKRLFEQVIQCIAQGLIVASYRIEYAGRFFGIKALLAAAEQVLCQYAEILTGKVLYVFLLNVLQGGHFL